MIQVIDNLDYSVILFDSNPELIEYIGTEIDEAFAKSAIENASFNIPQAAKEQLKIVYTSLHGTSIKAIPNVLEKAGNTDENIVTEQAEPSRNNATDKSPH